MTEMPHISRTSVQAALDRLLTVAMSNTGQSRIAANFLLAWWNAAELGGFDLADLFSIDRAIANDMAIIFAFLGQQGGAVYPDAFDGRAEIVALIRMWRRIDADAA